MPEQDQTLDLASGRFLNETAIRTHALACSKAYRAGKFTRVGQEFIDETKADVEAMVRELRNKYTNQVHPVLDIGENQVVTGLLLDKLGVELNQVIGRLIQAKVQKQPSCGCTLGRTR